MAGKKKTSPGKKDVVKDFDQIRETAREFYVFANRTKSELSEAEDFSGKSRTIADRVALLKGLLKDYQGESDKYTSTMQQLILSVPDTKAGPDHYYHERPAGNDSAVTGGEKPFININSRIRTHNPFFGLWKTCPVVPDVALVYFAFIEAFQDAAAYNWRPVERMIPRPVPLRFKATNEDCSKVDSLFDYLHLNVPDTKEDAVRKNFENYRELGVFREVSNNMFIPGPLPRGLSDDLLDFFSEVSPCGVIGSFIADKMNDGMLPEEMIASDVDCFRFKHHYISHALDSGVLCRLLLAIHDHREVLLKDYISYKGDRHTYRRSDHHIVPLRIISMVQTGRQYVVAFIPEEDRYSVFRLDYIGDLETGDAYEDFQHLRDELDEMESHMWGASAQISREPEDLETVDLIIRYDEDRFHLEKLQRECRCGAVEDLGDGRARFTAALYDSRELIPWIRTFTGRIESCRFSSPQVQEIYDTSAERMCELYGI